jgi:hypothetical protein
MSKLSRKEFKELLVEWRQNFINEENSKDALKEFFNFSKNELPIIITDLGPAGLEDSTGLGLSCVDGNHRLGIFERIAEQINNNKQTNNNNQSIPVIVLVDNDIGYLQQIKEKYKYRIISVNEVKDIRLNDEGKTKVIDNITKNLRLALFIEDLKISDISTRDRANKPTSAINDYILSLSVKFKEKNPQLSFNIKSLVSNSHHINNDDDDDFIIVD